MQKEKKGNSVNLYVIASVFAYIILNQGGYFAGAIISTGLIISLLLFRRKIRFNAVELIFLIFSVWYLFCSVRTGFDLRYLAKGLLPLLCLMFRFLLPDNHKGAEELCQKVIKLSFYIAIVSVLVYIHSCVTSARLLRMTFPFQYANASGIFFGIMFILSRYSGNEWAKKRQYVFFVCLILTQSVGSVGLTVLAEIFLSRNKKKTFLMIVFILLGAVVLKGRIYQSIGTFTERFLQMHDGVLCIADNPLFGIGAGRWELMKNLYQTGFYDAREIHGSIVQVGADSGIIGVCLFVASVIFALKCTKFSNKAYLTALLMILCHSCFDFTLAFTAMGFFVMLLFACGESNAGKVFEFKTAVKPVAVTALFLSFFVLSCGMYQIKKLDGIILSKNYPRYIKYYDTNLLSQKSVKTTENYAKALYATGKKQECLDVLENIYVLSPDMIVLKKGCCDDWREVFKYLETQPYNSVLYKTICYNSNDESLQKEAEERLNEAIGSMSFLGKILYNFKGESIL